MGLPKTDGSRWRILKKIWLTGERNGKSLQHSCLQNPKNSMKRQKDKTLKNELPRSGGPQYASGEAWRNTSRKNEEAEPKQKRCPIVGVPGGESKVQCCKEQYCTGTWNVQFSSVTQSCLTLCDPMNRSTPGLPVHHQLPEFTQTYLHQVSDAIQPSHPLSSPSPPAPNPSQHQSLFQ